MCYHREIECKHQLDILSMDYSYTSKTIHHFWLQFHSEGTANCIVKKMEYLILFVAIVVPGLCNTPTGPNLQTTPNQQTTASTFVCFNIYTIFVVVG